MTNLRTIIAIAAAALSGIAAADTGVRPLALEAAAQYRELAQFPEWSRPLAVNEGDPILAKRQVNKVALGGPQGADPWIAVWTSALAVEAGQAIDLYAQLENRKAAPGLLRILPQQPIAAEITGELVGETGGPLATVRYRDDGRGADQVKGDGIYSARYSLPAARAPSPGNAESVMVVVRAALPNGEQRSTNAGFLYSNPGARLTGRFRDGLRDGNLVLGAEVEVLAPGRYHLAGTVENLLGQPVAAVQQATQLDAGTQWLELPVYGLILRNLGAAAVQLGSVTLSAANGMPNALGPVLRADYRSSSYLPTAYTAEPYNRADLLDTAARLEADAAQAVSGVLH